MDRSLPASINDNRSTVKEAPPLKGSQWLNDAETNLKLVGQMIDEASQDQEGYGDDAVRLALGGLKNVGHVANAPVIKQGLQVAGALPWAAGQGMGAVLEHGFGVDPRYGHIAGELGDIAVGGGALKIGGKLARKGIKGVRTAKGTLGSLLEGGITAHAGTGLIKGGADDLLIAAKQARKDLLRPRPKGTKLSSRKAAEEFYGLDGSSAKELGFEFKNKGSSVDPNWGLSNKQLRNRQLSNRNQRILNVTESEKIFNAGKAKMKAIRAKNMEPHHIIPTHVSQKLKESMSPKDWVKTVKADAKKGIFHGNDPRNLVAARHSTKTPTHSAGKQSNVWHRLGTEEFPGYHNLEGQVKNIDDYYSYRNLMSENIRNNQGMNIIKKTKPQWKGIANTAMRHMKEGNLPEARWRSGNTQFTWAPKDLGGKGRGYIDIIKDVAADDDVFALKRQFFKQIDDLPSGTEWTLEADTAQKYRMYKRMFRDDPRITAGGDTKLLKERGIDHFVLRIP